VKPGDMVYELARGHSEAREVMLWEPSGNGRGRDLVVEAALDRLRVPGETAIWISWAPDPIRFQGPERMLARRVANMRSRVRRKDPLFAQEFEARELTREKYTVEACAKDLEHKRSADARWIEAWRERHPESKRLFADRLEGGDGDR